MALPASLTLRVVTPDRAIIDEQVDEVELPGAEGYFGVLPGHAPLLAELQVGEMWYRKGSERFFVAVAFGSAEVLPDRVTVLARVAERADDIDVSRAESAVKRAQEQLTRGVQDMDFERARISLLKSLARLQVAERRRMRG